MSKIAFIHLSDIHFRKESNSVGDIDQDLRNSIIYDIKHNAVNNLPNIRGLLIGGDIAFSGNKKEYEEAQKFISELVTILEIKEYDVYCVPGNHDVNRDTIKELSSIYEDQCKIDSQLTIDDADKCYLQSISRKRYPDLLYESIKEYNDFAGKYQCDLNSKQPFWEQKFSITDEFQICLRGINSCLISNEDDNKDADDFRPMYIGQSQIPAKNDNELTIILSHHPIECWKFKEDLVARMDKRADIQLYGHKHMQTMNFSNQRLLLSAGAVHPVRGNNWIPQYNWLSIEHKIIDENNIVEIMVYPRILSKDRNGFVPKIDNDTEKNYVKYTINLTKKRKEQDNYESIDESSTDESNMIYSNEKVKQSEHGGEVNKRKLVYMFYNLSYPDQVKILSELDLIDEGDKDKRYIDIFGEILNKAVNRGVLKKFYEAIENAR